jgi:hypothetical protein
VVLLRAEEHYRRRGGLTMTSRSRNWHRPPLIAAAALVLLPALVLAADRRARAPAPWQYNPDHKTVEMFQAIEEGQIDVKLIPKDSTECQVMIENKTDQPLNVKLPEAFAGVPVLAQLDVGNNLGVNRGNNNNWSSGGQGFGSGWGGGGIGMWNVPPEKPGQDLPAMFNVPPEKVGKLKVAIVCLEHGKPDPRPSMPYEIVPIEQFTDKKEVYELCRILGSGQVSQRAAQVAAWHFNNGMSWEELAAKRLRYANGTSRSYFSPQELVAGIRVATAAATLVQQRERLTGGAETPLARSANEASLSIE